MSWNLSSTNGKFHKVKGHHPKDFYQLKKEIERLIQESYFKKYVNDDSFQRPGEAGSCGRNNTESQDLEREMSYARIPKAKTQTG